MNVLPSELLSPPGPGGLPSELLSPPGPGGPMSFTNSESGEQCLDSSARMRFETLSLEICPNCLLSPASLLWNLFFFL